MIIGRRHRLSSTACNAGFFIFLRKKKRIFKRLITPVFFFFFLTRKIRDEFESVLFFVRIYRRGTRV